MSGFAIGLVSAVIGGSIGFITCGLLFASKNNKAEDLKTEEDYKREYSSLNPGIGTIIFPDSDTANNKSPEEANLMVSLMHKYVTEEGHSTRWATQKISIDFKELDLKRAYDELYDIEIEEKR